MFYVVICVPLWLKEFSLCGKNVAVYVCIDSVQYCVYVYISKCERVQDNYFPCVHVEDCV